MEPFRVDYENEKVFVDNRWYSRTELARLLTERLAALDYNIGTLSAAIEYLDQTLRSLQSFTVRLPPEIAAQLQEAAQKARLPAEALIREAVVSYLLGAALSKLA
jgi:hypothetical protein